MSAPAFGAALPDRQGAPDAASPVAGDRSTTVLDGLLSDLRRTSDTTGALTLTVNARPGYEVRCRTDIAYEELSVWTSASIDPAMAAGSNELLLGCTILAQCVVAIIKDGEDVVERSGALVTFHSPELQQALGTLQAVDAVRAFFVRDGHVTAASKMLLDEAGYGPRGVPTRR